MKPSQARCYKRGGAVENVLCANCSVLRARAHARAHPPPPPPYVSSRGALGGKFEHKSGQRGLYAFRLVSDCLLDCFLRENELSVEYDRFTAIVAA